MQCMRFGSRFRYLCLPRFGVGKKTAGLECCCLDQCRRIGKLKVTQIERALYTRDKTVNFK